MLEITFNNLAAGNITKLVCLEIPIALHHGSHYWLFSVFPAISSTQLRPDAPKHPAGLFLYKPCRAVITLLFEFSK